MGHVEEDDRAVKTNMLYGVAKYFASIINSYKARNGSMWFVNDEITIIVARQNYYDSVEFNCRDFRYFITQYDVDEYRFTVVRKPVVEVLSELLFTGDDLLKHDLFSKRLNNRLKHAAEVNELGTGRPTDQFSPIGSLGNG
jgi:hypothetical protein